MKLVDVGAEATGFIAVGQQATGVIAVGQSALGVIAVGQLARGFITVGQLSIGVAALGQGALGPGFAVGMFGIGGFFGGGGMLPLSIRPHHKDSGLVIAMKVAIGIALLVILLFVAWLPLYRGLFPAPAHSLR